MRLPIFFFFCLTLAACGSGSDGSSTPENTAPTISISTPDNIAKFPELREITVQAAASDLEDGTLDEITWTQTGGPEVAFTANGSGITFITPKVTEQATVTFVAEARDSEGAIGTAQLEITVTEQTTALFIAKWDNAPAMQLFRRGAADIQPSQLHEELSPLPPDSGAALSGYDLTAFALSVSPDRRLVAYMSDRDGDFEYELYVAKVDGSGEHIVSNSVRGRFAWSPTGKLIAFQNKTILPGLDGPWELWTIAIDDSGAPDGEPELVSGNVTAKNPANDQPAGGAYHFVWHPEGNRLIFRGQMETWRVVELWQVRIDAETGQPQGVREKLSGEILPHASGDTVGVNADFAVSPDGRHIAYRADPNAPDVYELYVTSLQTIANTVRVSGENTGTWKDEYDVTRQGWVRDFTWSADGRMLAFRGDIVTGNKVELFNVNIPAEGPPGARHTINGPEMLGELVEKYTWAPNGNRLAYTVDVDATFDYEVDLYVAKIGEDGAVVERANATEAAIAKGFANKPAWAPDGSKLAVWGTLADYDLAEVFIATLNENDMPDGGLHRVSHDITHNTGDFYHYEWSPDGNWIAYNGDPAYEGVNELFVVNVADPAHPSSRGFATGTISASDGDNENGAIDGKMRNSDFWTIANEAIYKWAPDSREIYFQGDLDRDEVIELYAYPVSTEVSVSERRAVSQHDAVADGVANPITGLEDGVIEFVVTGPSSH